MQLIACKLKHNCVFLSPHSVWSSPFHWHIFHSFWDVTWFVCSGRSSCSWTSVWSRSEWCTETDVSSRCRTRNRSCRTSSCHRYHSASVCVCVCGCRAAVLNWAEEQNTRLTNRHFVSSVLCYGRCRSIRCMLSSSWPKWWAGTSWASVTTSAWAQ